MALTEAGITYGRRVVVQDRVPSRCGSEAGRQNCGPHPRKESDGCRRRTVGPEPIVEDLLLRVIRNLEGSIEEDTVRNEYLLHAEIHQWLTHSSAPAHVDQLNPRVYAELFLTPDSDPWLGLVPGDTYTALENDGLVQARGKPPEAQVALHLLRAAQ